MKILALGPAGTNGHEAAHQLLRWINDGSFTIPGEANPSNISIELCDSHPDVFRRAVDENHYCVVPIESMRGAVDDTVRDFWLKYPFDRTTIMVIGEVSVPIEHVLVMRQGMELNPSTPVLSHPQAITQCRESLRSLGLTNFIPTNSTSGGGRMVAEDDRHGFSAALVSPFAASIYRLQVIKGHMEDARGGVTRFHLLGHHPCPAMEGGKTALIFRAENVPGAVYKAIEPIAEAGVDMTTFHSIQLTPGEYAFYLEFNEHAKTTKGFEIMGKIVRATDRILWLGSFPQERTVLERGAA